MIRNYITIAARNLLKSPTFSFVNIVGLALSIGACLLIAQYAGFELSYDRFHQSATDSYRVYLDIYKNGSREARSARVSPAVGAVFQNQFPEIDRYTRMVILGPDGVLTYNNRYTAESDIVLADSAFFEIFSFNLLRGNKETAFDEPFCVVITEGTAKKIFDEEDPLGKSVTINAKNFDGTSLPFKVTGVIADFPPNTHLNPGVLISYPTLFEFVGHRFDDSWTWNETYTYVCLAPGVNAESLEARFPQVVHRLNPQLEEHQLDWRYKLQPITDIHLRSDLQHEMGPNGNAVHVYSLMAVGVLLMLIAYVNFVNLVTVKAMQRAREVGIRKVSGAFRSQLVAQFLTESVVLNAIAVSVAIAITGVARPFVADLFGVTLSYAVYGHNGIWIAFISLLAALALASGLYPAFVLARYKPTEALKGSFAQGKSGNTVRKLFVTGQFTVAMILIALTITATVQVRFMRRHVLGFDPEQIIVIRSPKAHDYGYGTNFSGFSSRAGLLAHVTSVSGSNVVPGQEIYWYDDQVVVNGKETSGVFSMLAVSPNYFQHYNVSLLAGRAFTENSGDQRNWIINESAMRLLGFDNKDEVVGQKLRDGEIIGVVKNFHHESLKTAIPPILFTAGRVFNYYSVKVETKEITKTLSDLKALYSSLFPGSPYEYFFLDEFFDHQYRSDRRFNSLFGMFSGLAIVVACLGLFGLSSYLTERRYKEIGIRKVMGASVTNVVVLISKEFLTLGLVAGMMAIPLAYFVIEYWLEDYAIRIGMVWWLLTVPVVFVLLLALATVGLQTLKAALINPAVCLRSD